MTTRARSAGASGAAGGGAGQGVWPGGGHGAALVAIHEPHHQASGLIALLFACFRVDQWRQPVGRDARGS